MRPRSILFLCAAVLLSCQPAASPPAENREVAGLRQSQLRYDGFGRTAPATLNAVVVSGEVPLPPIAPPDRALTMVIRTASASIEVDSLEPAVAQVQQLAVQVGGYVANTELQVGKSRLRSATLEVKIPAPRFDEGLSGLKPIGKLETVSVSAEDVGEQYVDVTARMENARRLERRLLDLLANRTGKLKDVLDVEQSLARVREEIERYEGRIRYLREHTATSTLTVYVHEPVPVVGSAGMSVMGEAFRQAWRNFVALTALAVQSLGVVIPLGSLALLGWIVARRWWRVNSKDAPRGSEVTQ